MPSLGRSSNFCIHKQVIRRLFSTPKTHLSKITPASRCSCFPSDVRSVFTHASACLLDESTKVIRSILPIRYLLRRYDCYRLERLATGWGSYPLKCNAFARRSVFLTRRRIVTLGRSSLSREGNQACEEAEITFDRHIGIDYSSRRTTCLPQTRLSNPGLWLI